MATFQELQNDLLEIHGVFDISNTLPKSPRLKYGIRIPSRVDQLIFHHTATDGMSIQDIARDHITFRKFPGIAYHLIIEKDGTAFICNHFNKQSWHCAKNNFRSLSICINGALHKHHMTLHQWEKLKVIVITFATSFHTLNLLGHTEKAATECPGFYFPLADIKKIYYEMVKEKVYN